MSRRRTILLCLLVGILVGALSGLLGVWLLRSLGAIFGAAKGLLGEETAAMIGGIFFAFRTARILPPVLLLLSCGILSAVAWMAVLHNIRPCVLRGVLLAFLTLFALLIGTLGTFAFSYVNDVRFLDFLHILVEVLEAGLL